jgi:hypothetical protein
VRPEDRWNDPPLHQKLDIAISAAGWVLGCALAVGTAAWFRAVRRVIRAG